MIEKLSAENVRYALVCLAIVAGATLTVLGLLNPNTRSKTIGTVGGGMLHEAARR